MCRWMASHFHDWINYNGVEFSIELLKSFQILGVRQFFIFTVSKHTRMIVLWVKSKMFFIHYKVAT